MSRRPLAGVRVLECGIALAGPFAGSMLAEHGATVIKIERPGGGDPMRLLGPRVNDVALWWGVASRAKQLIALDFKIAAEKAVFLELVRDADVLVENYRPGVMDRLGLGWKDLQAINPRLIMLSVSGFGQTGPYAPRPGFGKIAEGLSGIVPLTGRPDDVPLHVGFSLADTAAGLTGFFAVSMLLYQRDIDGGKGAHIDVALFEPLFRMAECQLALTERRGTPAIREGSNNPYGWGASGSDSGRQVGFACADGHWVMALLGDQADAEDEIARELAALDSAAALRRLAERGVAAAFVHDGLTLASTSYFVERGDVVVVDGKDVGMVAVPGEVPKGREGPALPQFRAPVENEDRAAVLGLAKASA